MKRGWVFLCLLVTVFAFSSVAKANLTVIGHANYLGNNYKLIFDNAQGLVWLDFSNEPCEGESCNSWEEQMQWAEELNGEGILTYNLNPGISISWKGDWRLPITDEGPVNMDLEPDEIFGWEGPDQEGYYDYHAGFNLLNSELGYLYYISLGNSACYNPEEPADPYWQCYPPHIEPPNTEPFDNLSTFGYWSGTKYSPVPVSDGASWNFNFSNGDQGPGKDVYQWGAYGIAVRPAHVSIFNLQVIGTATYLEHDFNLIYDKAQGLVWLDFTNPKENAKFWDDQIAWAEKLNDKNVLTENLLSGFNIVWGGPWRLPETDESKVSFEGPWKVYDSDNPGCGWGGPLSDGTYDYLWGYNMINSEMGYLYYVLLENLGSISIEGEYDQPASGLLNTGPFRNLGGDVYYWSGTESSIDSDWAWYFSTGDGGSQGAIQKNWDPGDWLNTAALAVRPGVVQTIGQALVEKAGEILDLFDEAVADGTLEGTGNAKAAPRRLNAVRNKIIEAESFIAGGDYESALAILYDIYKLSDGKPKPPDLVQGSAAADLADEVWTLIEMIEEATS